MERCHVCGSSCVRVPFICVRACERVERYERNGDVSVYTLSICCPVAKVHTALQFSRLNIHSLKVKKYGFKPNNTSILSDEYLIWLQLYSSLNQCTKTSVRKPWQTVWDSSPVPFHFQFSRLIARLCSAVSSESMTHTHTHTLQTHCACACGNLATVDIHSQGFLFENEKKNGKKRHKMVMNTRVRAFYCTVYMIVYV